MVQSRSTGSIAFAESLEKVLMGKEKIQHRHGQARAACGFPQVFAGNPAGLLEMLQRLRTGGKPGQSLKTKDFRPFRAQGMGHRQDGVKTFSLILCIQGHAPFQRLGGYVPGRRVK